MADVKQIQAILEDAQKFGEVKKAIVKLSKLLDKVAEAQAELDKLIGGTAAPKVKKPKADHPKPGTAPARLCKAMGATPKTAAAIAKAVGSSEATVKVHLGKYKCFSNVRGKGYIYKKPTTKKK